MSISGLLATESEEFLGFPDGAAGKESTCQCRRCKRRGFGPCEGRSPGVGNGKPIQYSCLEDPMDRGAWRATVCGVTKSQMQLKRLSMHAEELLTYSWYWPLSDIGFANTFSRYLGCLFIASSAEAVLPDTIPLFIFASVACAFTVTLRKASPRPEIATKSRNFFLIFCF